jgi:hypothetical protein
MTKAGWQDIQTRKKNRRHLLEPNGRLLHHRYAQFFLFAGLPDIQSTIRKQDEIMLPYYIYDNILIPAILKSKPALAFAFASHYPKIFPESGKNQSHRKCQVW